MVLRAFSRSSFLNSGHSVAMTRASHPVYLIHIIEGDIFQNGLGFFHGLGS